MCASELHNLWLQNPQVGRTLAGGRPGPSVIEHTFYTLSHTDKHLLRCTHIAATAAGPFLHVLSYSHRNISHILISCLKYCL